MKKGLACFLLLLMVATVYTFAQTSLIWDESFGTNENGWYTDEWISLQNGKYLINAEKNNAASWRMTPIKDCKIQIETEWKGGLDGYGYGLVFRLQNNQQFYVFWIAAQGYFLAGKIDGGSSSLFNKWTRSDKINIKGKNLIEIEVKGSHIIGSVNGSKVFDADDTSYPEGGFGFYCQKGVMAEFDNLKVWEY